MRNHVSVVSECPLHARSTPLQCTISALLSSLLCSPALSVPLPPRRAASPAAGIGCRTRPTHPRVQPQPHPRVQPPDSRRRAYSPTARAGAHPAAGPAWPLTVPVPRPEALSEPSRPTLPAARTRNEIAPAPGLVCAVCRVGVRGLCVTCGTCGHGGHPAHMRAWFQRSPVCATGCCCRCLEGAELTSR